jgi:light-independent protochlorophyllide reductase subunit B
MFREDFEFNDNANPSHLGAGTRGSHIPQTPSPPAPPFSADDAEQADTEAETKLAEPAMEGEPVWEADAERELKKIPFFVRGKARRNTERFALERGAMQITVDTLYDAKAHFGR